MKIRFAAGFTLIELMIVLGIVGIMAVVGIPSFANFIAMRSVKSAAAELYGSLNRARSEAITRNGNVVVSPKSGAWQNGWQVLSPTNAVLDDRNAVGGATISGPTSITYKPSGRLTATTAPSFVFTASGASGIYQCVSVDLIGRPYMKAASTC